MAATALADGGKVAVIDTERGSARLYADYFKFDVLELPMDHRNFSPEVYVEAIHSAEDAGYDVIVIDSMSHAWEGEGGALSLVDQAVAASKSGNSYVAWRKVTPLHNKLIDAMLQSPAHIIVTMRSKMDYEQVDEGGKKTIKKLGMAPIQRAGVEYEFTIVCDMDVDHRLIVSKSRCKDLADRQMVKPDLKFFKVLADWMAGGADAPVRASIPTSENSLTAQAMAETKTKDYTGTFAQVVAEAQKKYGKSEQEIRDDGERTSPVPEGTLVGDQDSS